MQPNDVKVSGLPQDSSLDGNHYVIINDPTGPTTKRGFLSVLASWLFSQANIPAGSGSPITRASEMFANFVQTGMVWSGDAYASTRNASMTAGTAYINGLRVTVSAVVARSFTASKDTYVDLLSNGDGTATVVYTEVANGAASPALAANSIRLAKIVTGASNIAAASSVQQLGQDSLNNPYYPNGAVGGAQLNVSDLYNNLKIAYTATGSNPAGTGTINLSGNGLRINITAARACRAMIEVMIACSSTSDFEFLPILYLNGVEIKRLTPVAAPGFGGNRATMRGIAAVVDLPAGASTIDGGASFSSGSSLSIPANAAYIKCYALGKITA